jgi:predicted nuclease of predicted toxin-antitoxin system
MRFLVDENPPFSLIKLLQDSGHDVIDVAASLLRGSSDERLWKLAAREQRILMSKDLDFPIPQVRPYPPGLILIRVPDTFTGKQIASLFSKAMKTSKLKDLEGRITVVAPGRIRVRSLESYRSRYLVLSFDISSAHLLTHQLAVEHKGRGLALPEPRLRHFGNTRIAEVAGYLYSSLQAWRQTR